MTDLLTFNEVVERIADGKGYRFKTEHMMGHFYKAPFPEDDKHTARDGACSAITYWVGDKPSSPVMLLDEFQSDEAQWKLIPSDWPY